MIINKILAATIRIINKSFLFHLFKSSKYLPLLFGSKTFYSQISDYKYYVEEISQENNTLFVARRGRLNLYYNGINRRLSELQDQYLTPLMDILPKNSLIVDVGANIGEFAIYWDRRGYKVLAIEPDPIEFDCLKSNLSEEKCINKGLWKNRSILKFYLNNDTGDSSLFQTKKNQKSIDVQVDTLDNLLQFHEGPIGLIKLEAEGGEPEILEGSIQTLKKTHYITVDVGLERGLKQESTLVDVSNILFKCGFKMCEYNSIRMTILFKNTSFIDNQ